MTLAPGDTAPTFDLVGRFRATIKASSIAGRNVVVDGPPKAGVPEKLLWALGA